MKSYKNIKRDDVAIIKVRFLEIKKDDSMVVKVDNEHKDGYYEYLLPEDILSTILSSKNPKDEMFEYLVSSTTLNRSFLEFMQLEMQMNSSLLLSVLIDGDREIEYSYMQTEYIDEGHILEDAEASYQDEWQMSDFDFYPYGLV